MTTPVIVWGLGKLGRAAVHVCLDAPDVELAAVVTSRPNEAELPASVPVLGSLEDAVLSDRTVLVLHCGHALEHELEQLLARSASLGADIVTSSGFFAPAHQMSDGGAALHGAAVRAGTHVVAAGVHPGIVLDVLPSLVLDLAPQWREVTVVKPSDARSWPIANRHMQGLGEARELLESTTPYPLSASAHLVAAAAGCGVESIDETRVADVVDHDVVLVDEVIPAGLAVGFQQRCVARLEGDRVLTLVWRPSVDVSADTDLSLRIDVPGESWLSLRLDGGFREDPYLATAQRMLHVGLSSRLLAPGLHRAVDVGLSRPGF